MRNIRCTVCYDGTNFSGWQRQQNIRTVQGAIESALTRLHGGETSTTAAGRTDAGVHAVGQVINFATDSSVPTEKYHYAINQHLPADVRIIDAEEVDAAFNARKWATSRSYRYLIRVSDVLNPFDRNLCHRVIRHPNIEILNRMASVLVGTHDYATFAAAGDGSLTTMRDVGSASFHISGPYIEFRIRANAFLWKMVRSIVGTLLDAEADGKGPDDVRAIMESKDRSRAGATAPARGLYLHQVYYSGERKHV